MMTPTLKLKRYKIINIYKKDFENFIINNYLKQLISRININVFYF